MILRFEPLAAHHIPAILEIEAEANPSPWSERSFQNELTNPQSAFLVAIGSGRVVGYGGYWRVVDEAHITTVAIHSGFRRQGIGRKLVVEMLKAAREEGMTCSTLEVRATNEPAIKLYEDLGFKGVAKRKSYYPDKQDALVMWLYHLDEWQAPPSKGASA